MKCKNRNWDELAEQYRKRNTELKQKIYLIEKKLEKSPAVRRNKGTNVCHCWECAAATNFDADICSPEQNTTCTGQAGVCPCSEDCCRCKPCLYKEACGGYQGEGEGSCNGEMSASHSSNSNETCDLTAISFTTDDFEYMEQVVTLYKYQKQLLDELECLRDQEAAFTGRLTTEEIRLLEAVEKTRKICRERLLNIESTICELIHENKMVRKEVLFYRDSTQNIVEDPPSNKIKGMVESLKQTQNVEFIEDLRQCPLQQAKSEETPDQENFETAPSTPVASESENENAPDEGEAIPSPSNPVVAAFSSLKVLFSKGARRVADRFSTARLRSAKCGLDLESHGVGANVSSHSDISISELPLERSKNRLKANKSNEK